LISDEKTRGLVNDGFDRIVDLLDTEITNAESTAKPLILQKIAEGQLNKDSLKDIGVEVAKSVMNQLPEKTINLLQQEVNDVSLYVNKKLEQRLDKLKQDTNSGVSKTVISEVIIPQANVTELTNKLNQVQLEKDNLQNQMNQIANDKVNAEQTNQQLVIEKQQLEADKQTLQSKLDSITQVVQPTTTM